MELKLSVHCAANGRPFLLCFNRHQNNQYEYCLMTQFFDWQAIASDVNINLYFVKNCEILHDAISVCKSNKNGVYFYGQCFEKAMINDAIRSDGSYTIIAIITRKIFGWFGRAISSENRQQVQQYLEQCAGNYQPKTAEAGVQTEPEVVYIFAGEQFATISREILMQKAQLLAAQIASSRGHKSYYAKFRQDPRNYECDEMDHVIMLRNVQLSVVQCVVHGLQTGGYQFANDAMAAEVRKFAENYFIQEAIRAASNYISVHAAYGLKKH